MAVFFWFCVILISYIFIGYGIILFLLTRIKKTFFFWKKTQCISDEKDLPSCSVIIAAYNEEHFIRNKILNTFSLIYPNHLLKIYIVADGSTDQTVNIVKEYPQINLYYNRARNGKIDAVNRIIEYIDSEIIVFTDANTYLNNNALINICKHYLDPKIGGVAGEKRIFIDEKADASSAGENFYWRYESKLKQWDSDLYSAIGAAGELYSIRRVLYESPSPDIILDDFMISMKIAIKGYRINYEPDAYAMETSSADINEELKRKIRIAAGGIQSIIKLKKLLNPMKYPILSFLYISHRVLRWTIAPFLLILIFILNIYISFESEALIYKFLLVTQSSFYCLALIGNYLNKKQLKFKFAFIPYYFCFMNYAVIMGIFKYYTKQQNAIWDKAKRKDDSTFVMTNQE